MEISSVLVEYEDEKDVKTYSSSGILIGNRFVIITANIFANKIKIKEFKNKIFNNEQVYVNPSEILLINNPKLNVILNVNDNKINYQDGNLMTAFISHNIRNSCQKILRDWTIDVEESDLQIKELLSLFFVLDIKVKTSSSLKDFKCLLKNFIEKIEKNFYIGLEISIDSTPFGNRSFFNTYSRGIISNVTGENNCLVLTDCPTALGCEGGLVLRYNDHNPIGIVLSSISWWKGEWMGLTLITTFSSILPELLSENRQILTNLTNDNELYEKLCKNVARIVCGLNWGSTILINKEKGLFLTNSHVVEKFDECEIYWKNFKFPAKVLFKTNSEDHFDLALVQIDFKQLKNGEMEPAILSEKSIQIGDEIYALGFPIFSNNVHKKPTLTKGHISKVTNAMIKTTCSVLAGSSGGGIFTNGGNLIGIIVSNAKLQENNVIYPRINMAIPLSTIREILKEFLVTNDLKVLQKLSNLHISNEWKLFESKL